MLSRRSGGQLEIHSHYHSDGEWVPTVCVLPLSDNSRENDTRGFLRHRCSFQGRAGFTVCFVCQCGSRWPVLYVAQNGRVRGATNRSFSIHIKGDQGICRIGFLSSTISAFRIMQ